MEWFKHKNVLVTGDTKGIGKAIAESFLAEGAVVVGVSSSQESPIENDHYHHIAFNLENSNSISELWKKVERVAGRVDVAINNAGICQYQDFLALEASDLEKTLRINFTSHVLLSKYVSQNMIEHNVRGKIIFISSVSGFFGGSKQVDYTASKAAMILAAKSMAAALGKHGITVNAVCPGTIETDMNRERLQDKTVHEERLKRIPLGRFGTPEDVAKTVLFLASGDADYISGTTVVVDGGWTCALS